MKILPNAEILNLALLVDSTLVICDVHIGYEEALNKQGILVPRVQFEDIVKRIISILEEAGALERIIVNGDLKHQFGSISDQEWRNTLKFIDLLGKHCKEVVLVKGNHDTILGPIAKKRNISIVDSFLIEPSKTLVLHGDKLPSKEQLKECSAIIIGHEHPAVSIKEGARIEQFKCFLKGTYKRKPLIVQHSVSSIAEGTDLLRDEILSPLLEQDITDFEVYVVEDKVYKFGKLKNLMKRN